MQPSVVGDVNVPIPQMEKLKVQSLGSFSRQRRSLPSLSLAYPMRACWVSTVMSDSFNPMDSNPPGFYVLGISQAKILEWVAISFSRGSFQPRDRTRVSCTAGKFFTIWATRQVPKLRDYPVLQESFTYCFRWNICSWWSEPIFTLEVTK